MSFTISIYPHAELILRDQQELANSGVKHVSDQARIIGDSVLRLIFSRLFSSMRPHTSSGEMTSFLSKSLSSDVLASYADESGLSEFAKMTNFSSKARCELIESYFGYIIMSRGMTDGIKEIFDNVSYIFNKEYAKSINVEHTGKII